MNDNTTMPPSAAAWCILRTSPGRTLGLMTALKAAGFDVWTPQQVQTRRRPRSKVTVEHDVAIAPTFVFARAVHVRELVAATTALINPYPAFSIFRHAGRIPLIAEHEIDGMREAEERARLVARRKRRKAYVLGQRVRITEGAFAGMSGEVEKGGKAFVMVAFGQAFRMMIASSILSPDEVEQSQPIMGAAA